MIDETNITSVDETTQNVSSPNPQKSGKVKYCEKCHKQYDAINKVCPFCGHKNKYTAAKVGIGVMVGGTILFGVIPDIAKDKDNSSSVPDRAVVTEADTHTKVNESVTEAIKSISTTMIVTEAPTTTQTQLPIGKANALRSAKSYIEISDFSYTGLIEQLEFEQYSHEDAVYAADNCGANWKEEAANAAKRYLEITPFSRNELIEQLKFEGYTDEEAEYGVKQAGY